MRDIIITIVIFGMLPFILRNPRIGAYAWAWISMMIPHRAAFGFARTMPFGQMIAIATLIGFLFSCDRKPFPFSGITVTLLFFVFWMSVTSLFAINATGLVFDQWIVVLKIHLMLFVTMMLIRGRQQIEQLIWVVVLSIGFYGVKGGVWTILTGGGSRVWGPTGGVIQGNNELGLALVMLIPFMWYLYQTASRRLIRWGLVFCMVTSSAAILGTQSRGALVALIAMVLVLVLKGKRPIQLGMLVAGGAVVAALLMPATWTDRMNTIQTFDQDTSAMSRLYTWTTLWNAALDRPLVGTGFRTDNQMVFALYAPDGGLGVYKGGDTYVAHSIYFQALGEHGFPGLLLYLLFGLLTWRTAARLARQTVGDPDYGAWVPLLMRMVQVSVAAFAVGGAFLTLVHFDLPYYIASFVVLVDATLRERAKSGVGKEA
jgi:probable O-glycosylation ligase (exosortase A-associated)